MTDAIFVPDGELLIPQPTACGPWFPGVQHGGAITGLIARAIEATPSAQPMMLTRLTVDMSRKVPMGPTKVDVEVVRDGKRVQALECRYVVDGDIVGRASAMRIRLDGGVVGADNRVAPWPEDTPPPGPDEIGDPHFMFDGLDFVQNFTMRRTEPEPGRSVSWLRLNVPFVAGETTSPLMFAAAVADMIPSAGSVMDFENYLSVNPDLSMHFHRLPVGEWIGHTALVRVSPDGFGQTDAQLFDLTGGIGRSLKSLLIDPR
ncbi:MAG: thioesterase family protein [Acidimicrobiales bacterium]